MAISDSKGEEHLNQSSFQGSRLSEFKKGCRLRQPFFVKISSFLDLIR